MDIFRQGRGGNTEFTLRPAFPGLRNIVIGAVVIVVALFLLSFAVRVTRIEAGRPPARRLGNPSAHRLGPLFAAHHANY